MRCPNCGNEIVENAKFCPKCGSKQEQKCFCSKCKAEINPSAKFCPICGTSQVQQGQGFRNGTQNQFSQDTQQNIQPAKKDDFVLKKIIEIVFLVAIEYFLWWFSGTSDQFRMRLGLPKNSAGIGIILMPIVFLWFMIGWIMDFRKRKNNQ